MSEFERERRQLSLVVDRLEAYRAGELSLRQLVEELDALWNELTLLTEDWRQEFRGHWWTLEQVHAVALDRGYAELPPDHQVVADEAVDQLRFLVDTTELADS